MADTDKANKLPVSSVLPEMKAALQDQKQLILEAPPGAGKTTLVPLALLDEPWLAGQTIVVLEPRRLAARAAARRMAALLNERTGETVGYRVRLDSKVSRQTRIEVVTEGILTRMLQRDAELSGVGAVIFDEFHERSLHADLGLALTRDVQAALRPELRLLIMSATIDTTFLASRLEGAQLVTTTGRCFPVETLYRPLPDGDWLPRHTARVVHEAWRQNDGSILVFLPGAGEIGQVMRELNKTLDDAATHVCPLYGNLSRRRQDDAIEPASAGERKIVLATSIAETSLTIRGISVVIDAGLQRSPRFDPNSGMTRLETMRVSRAAADQRRGRAGRLTPGTCYRLWSSFEDSRLEAQTTPEIQVVDLTALALELANWGTPDPQELNWIDPPPQAPLEVARQLLQQFGALHEDSTMTAHGRKLLGLGMHPRLAQMLVQGRAMGQGALACRLAALLEDRDVLKPTESRVDADVRTRLDVLNAVAAGDKPRLPGYRVEYKACRQRLKLARRWMQRLQVKNETGSPDAAGAVLLEAYPDRLARKRPNTDCNFLLANGKGAVLPVADRLTREEFLVAAQLDAGRSNADIFLAAGIDQATVEQRFAAELEDTAVVEWDSQTETVLARRQTRLGKLVLRDGPLAKAPTEKIRAAMLEGIRELGLDCLPWTSALRTWQARVLLLRDQFDDPWPDVSDAALENSMEHWLGPFLHGVRSREDLGAVDLHNALYSFLDYDLQRQLDELAPTHLRVPSGSRLPLDYRNGPLPVLAARVQQMFGADETPCIARGRVRILVHLLSPAGRPVQITKDLKSFWADTYAEVRKQLRGRYPKHYWPEDPKTAKATDRVRPKNG